MNGDIDVSIRPYAEGDLWLLEKTLGNPYQMVLLNGPESIEQIRKRHNKFLAMSADPHAGCQFTILVGALDVPAGNVGYWESEWKGKAGWEMGWFVLPEFQGRGIATMATRLVIDLITKLESHRFVFAFPSVENHNSNAICRKLGFILTEQVTSEYPPGSKRLLRCNIWMLTLPGRGIGIQQLTPDNRLWGPDWPKVRREFSLDSSVAHLNHGSFGAVLIPVQKFHDELRRRVESNPMKSLSRDLRKQIDEARLTSARFLGADPDGFAFVHNATTGANSVLTSPILHAGDEVLVTDQTYEAIKHAAERACLSNKARLVVAKVPLPARDSEELVESIMGGVSKKTRLAIIDHIASPTGLVYPVKRLIEELHRKNVLVLVDAAHAPGMVDVNLDSLQPDFWTGNFHKWCCSPRGSAGLWVSEEHRKLIKPIITSWYYNEKYPDSFRWLGTDDYTSYLSVPEALRFMEGLGWDRIRTHNRKLARYARDVVGSVPGMVPIKPEKDEELFEAMTLVQLPEGVADTEEKARALQARFGEELRIEAVPIAWNGHGYLRLSAQVYNAPGEYDRLAEGLPRILDRGTLDST